MSWLYFAVRSEREMDPVLIWPHRVATARSAMLTSSVSPEDAEVIIGWLRDKLAEYEPGM